LSRTFGTQPTGTAESDRRDSNSSYEHGKLMCFPLTLRSHGAGALPASLRPDLNWGPPPYQGGALTTRATKAKYARRDSNPQTHGPQPCPSTRVAARAPESRRPVSNRAVRRTRAKPQAVRGGVASGAGLEPAERQVSGTCWERRRPTRNRCAGRESNPQTARFELASFAS
jgi:hypothetical protein